MDGHGFVLTDVHLTPDDLDGAWAALGRSPRPFETSVPAVLAAGEVWHGSMKRVASALGEGASAVSSALVTRPRSRIARRQPAQPARPPHRPTTRRGAVVGSVLLGAASGLRSQLGVATLVARSDPSLPAPLRRPWTRRLLVAAAAGELVVDKLPATPSRLAPPGFVSRLALGALAAGLFAQTRHAPWLPAAAVGASSAAVAAKLGHDVRARLARHAPDPAVAVVEDALALGLAAAGASR